VRRALPLLLAVAACSGSSHSPSPPSQRIVYRVVDDAGVQSTTTIDVSPPYRARSVSRDANGAVTGGFAWDARGLYTITPTGTEQTVAVAPGFPGPFSGLAVALPVAERQHLVSRLGTSAVLGRSCVTWLSREPLDGAPLAPATRTDRTSTCVDAEGRLLFETWYVGGRLVRTRTATRVGSGPSIAGDALFPQTPTLLPSTGTGFVVRDSPRAELLRLLEVPAPSDPAGFRPDASVAVLDLDAAATGFTREAAVLTWLRRDELVSLRFERDLSGSSKGTVRGAPVDLGVLGTGHVEPVLAGLRVVVDGSTGLRAIVTADLPEDELLTWVRTLRFRPGP
jgi:hypothetical protein